MKLRATRALMAGVIGLAGLTGAASAQTLKIALSAEPTSADPNYHKMTANDALATHIYSYLVARDDDPAVAYESADSESDQLQLLREGMAELDARSRDIIRRRWLDADSKVTLQELADEYGVSAERIRQVEANALKKMKALFSA